MDKSHDLIFLISYIHSKIKGSIVLMMNEAFNFIARCSLFKM
jgi:hypothetical protein